MTYFIFVYTLIEYNWNIPYQLNIIGFFSFNNLERWTNQQQFVSKGALSFQTWRQLYSLTGVHTYATSTQGVCL